jgi:hypothetical protein
VTIRPFLNQGDPQWAKATIGSSTTTMQQAGCVLTALAIALRSLGIDSQATPVTVQAKALAAWRAGKLEAPFLDNTAAAFIDRVGTASRLDVGAEVRGRTGRLWSTLMTALNTGRALMHVDNRDDGVEQPHHWVLALRVDGPRVIYADPDGGLEGAMPLESLESRSPKGRAYRVLGVRSVARALTIVSSST